MEIAGAMQRVTELAHETLADEVNLDAAPRAGAHVSEVSIDGEPLTLGLSLV